MINSGESETQVMTDDSNFTAITKSNPCKKYNKYCAANYTIIAKFVLLTKESKRHVLPKEPKKHYDK